jgi:uncharacterized membrane protein
VSNPVIEETRRHDVSSAVAVAGHPIHAMSVAFPISLVLSGLACDVFYWWTGDPFWVRAGVWACGGAFVMGVVAAMSGIAELLMVRGIRKRPASWTHGMAAMTLLSIAGANWGLRLDEPELVVLPHGLFLSVLASIFVGLAGWHGGKLVFDHGIGISISEADRSPPG